MSIPGDDVEPGVGMRPAGRCCLSQAPGLGWAAWAL